MASTDAVTNGAEKKAKAPKEKKPRAPKGTKPAPSHPTYLQMITEAITTLKERTGSSQFKIAKFIGEKYKADLPGNYEKILLIQLRNLSKTGKLTKVKGSFKLSDELKAAAKAAAKPKKVSDKPKAGRPPKEAVKKAGPTYLIRGLSYKMGVDQVMWQCVLPKEVENVMHAGRMGEYMGHKVIKTRIY